MESTTHFSENRRITQRAQFNSRLFVCFFVCLISCLLVMQGLPLPSYEYLIQGEIVYFLIRFLLTISTVVNTCVMIQMIRKRVQCHEEQRVFWPLRCPHCADAVGFLGTRRITPDENREGTLTESRSISYPGISRITSIAASSTSTLDCEVDNEVGNPSDLERQANEHIDHSSLLISSKHTPSGNRTTCSARCSLTCGGDDNRKMAFSTEIKYPDCDCNDTHQERQSLFKAPHKSLVNIFLVICIVNVCNVPFMFIADIMCLVNNIEYLSILDVVTLLPVVAFDICFIVASVVALYFFNIFYDAIFLQERKIAYILGSLFLFPVCITMLLLIRIISARVDSFYTLDMPCQLNGTFGSFLMGDYDNLVPLYIEGIIIVAGLAWHMWFSVLPKSVLHLCDGKPTFALFEKTPSISKVLRKLRLKVNRVRAPTSNGIYSDDQNLITGNENMKQFRTVVRKFTIFVLFLGAVYFVVCKILIHYEHLETSESLKLGIKWYCEIAICLPLFGMYRLQIMKTKSSKVFPLRKSVSILYELQSHDRLLLLSCSSIFIINIFRVTGAVRFLLCPVIKDTDTLVLAASSIVCSLFKIIFTWEMTSFLFTVQRQMIQSVAALKLTSICLIYTVVLRATLWVTGLTEVQTWLELYTFYGDSGPLIGIFLQPVASLYGIHASVVAYEHYKLVFSDLVVAITQRVNP